MSTITIISGPAASGKTTKIRKMAGNTRIFGPHDTVGAVRKTIKDTEAKTAYFDEVKQSVVESLSVEFPNVKFVMTKLTD